MGVVFDALAHQRRRSVLRCLWDHQTELALADLAEIVATRETGERITDIPADEIQQVYVSLYHTHVPSLVDAGLVEYDQESDIVVPARETPEILDLVERFLDQSPGQPDSNDN